MWELMPSQVPVPGQGVDMVDVPLMLGWLVLGTVIVLGGFVFLLIHLTRERPATRVVRCPLAKAPAVVVVQGRDDVADDVRYCSRWAIGCDTDCDRACLRRAAWRAAGTYPPMATKPPAHTP